MSSQLRSVFVAFVLGFCAVAPACGPYVPPCGEGNVCVDVVMKNSYAESIFNVFWRVKGTTEWTEVTSGLRLDIFDSKRFVDAVGVPAGTMVEFDIQGQSLGEWHEFVPLESNIARTGTCTFDYDYDLATANFVVHWGCPDE